MPWRGPRFSGEFPTLGYGLLRWMENHLVVPDGPRQGEPFVATREQAVFVVRLYRLKTNGKLFHRGAQLRRVKGWGKSPIVGGMAWADALGPARFGGWDDNGEPIGVRVPTPWVQVAAAAEKQTENTWSLVRAMGSPELGSDVEFQYPEVDAGDTRIKIGINGKIEYVTSKAGTREGQRTTFAIYDETHLWTESNGGKRLEETITRNLEKTSGLFVETTNMYQPGERSVAEITDELAPADVLIDAGPTPPDVPDLSAKRPLRRALKIAYGDSASFVDLDRLVSAAQDKRTKPNLYRRFFLNQRVKGDDNWQDLDHWKTLKRRTKPDFESGITLGFTGARYSDGAALIACDITTGYLFPVATWEAKGDDWELPVEKLEASIAKAFTDHTVIRFYANPSHGMWDSYIDGWIAEYGKKTVIRWTLDQEKRLVHALAAFDAAVRAEEGISHSGSVVLERHISHAQTRLSKRAKDDEGNPMVIIERPHPDQSIVAAQAAVMAYEARGDAIAAAKPKKKHRSAGF